MPNHRKLTSAGLIAFLAAGVLSSLAPNLASAFDPKSGGPYDVGWMPETCFYGTNWPSGSKNEFNQAVDEWLNKVTNLGLVHHTGAGGFTCHTGYNEARWFVSLGGAYASVPTNADYIGFALEDGDGDPFPWHFTNEIPSSSPDFRSVAVHELGHAIGLLHPENSNSYNYFSWDGQVPTMVASMPDPPGVGGGRNLEQDDIAGGYWMKSRQWVAYPEMGSDAIPYWDESGGSLYSCNTSWACLDDGPSKAFYTIRFTVDERDSRSTPDIKVWWERGPAAIGSMSLELQTRNVLSSGSVGTWVSISRLPYYDNSSTWVVCSWSTSFAATQVRDIRLIIQDDTDGMIRIERVEAVDG